MTCAGLAQLAVRAALAGEGPSPPVPAGGFTVARPGGIPPGTGSTRGVRKPERARIHDTPPHDPSGRHGPAPKARHDSPGARRPGRSCAREIPVKGENEPCPVSPRGHARIAPRTGPRLPLRGSESTPAPFARRRGPRRAPNVVLILLDDVGCGAASFFSGPALFLDKGRPVCSNPFVAGRSVRPARRTADTRDGLRPWRRHGQGPRCHGPGGRGGPCHRQSRDHNAAAVLDQGDPGLRLRHRHAGRPAA